MNSQCATNCRPPSVPEYLRKLKSSYSYSQIVESLESLRGLKVLVVGDLIVDEYCYCQVSGTVTKAPVIAGIFELMHQMAGGGAVIARHLKELADRVDYVATIGTRSDKHVFVKTILEQEGVNCTFFQWPESFTVTKTRYISGGYPGTLPRQPHQTQRRRNNIRLFEIGYMPRGPLPTEVEQAMCAHLSQTLAQYDVVIVADFGHGTVSKRVAATVAENATWWAVNAQTNSSNFGFNRITKYKNANYVCIDELEARLPSGDKVSPFHEVAEELWCELHCASLMITRATLGLVLWREDEVVCAPALAEDVIDTVGAGDAVLAVTTLCQRADLNPAISAYLGSCYGALASRILGNEEPVRKAALLEYLQTALSRGECTEGGA